MDDCYICRQQVVGEGRRYCRCPGETGNVHEQCLSQWVTSSGTMQCNFCGTLYRCREVTESLWQWMMRIPFWISAMLFSVLVLIFFYIFLCYRAFVIMLFHGGHNVPWIARVLGLGVLVVSTAYGVFSVKERLQRALEAIMRFYPRESRKRVIAIQE